MTIESDDAQRGADALEMLRSRQVDGTPDGLFEHTMREVAQRTKRIYGSDRFWLGTGFGAAVATALFVLAFSLGLLLPNVGDQSGYHLALNEVRQMDVAIETDRVLQGATITVILAGNVDLDGFPGQRELSWSETLAAGVNRLSLPLIATGTNGGQVIVRLKHPQTERVFVVNLETDA